MKVSKSALIDKISITLLEDFTGIKPGLKPSATYFLDTTGLFVGEDH